MENGPVVIQPKVFQDSRGYFFESFSLRDFEANIGPVNFVQDNESFSISSGVIRGLHFQKGEHSQAKLVRVVQGIHILCITMQHLIFSQYLLMFPKPLLLRYGVVSENVFV
ncbi:MAG: dTDP-4-dehydrorhamnose 3,5-epimerase family protein [Bacteroidales bacterium]|nr:dTDP-4-dehydrorhamnose 3,5-epimerase family protein [Bacteroidales bacterium]